MATYKIISKNLDGDTLGEFENFENLEFSLVLNREGDARFDLSLSDNKATAEMIQLGKREIYIYRDDTLVWGGSQVMLDGTLDRKSDKITIYAKGFFDLLRTRYTDASVEYTDTDAGQIAWDLIYDSQQKTDGDFGITMGTIQSSVNRSRLYEYKNIYEAIVELSEVKNGFDFEITPSKVFNVYYPLKGDDVSDSVILEWGKNIDKIDFAFDFTEPANQAIVVGAGYGEVMNVETRTNTTMRSQYKLRQLVYPYKDVENVALLQAKGDQLLLEKAYVRREYIINQTPDTEPEFGTVDVGDWIRVRAEHGYLQIADVVRIKKIIVRVKNGIEFIEYNFQYD